jgi:alcohol dehydrogenase class IV
VHALSHALGGLKSVSLHHGTLNAVLLPAVLRFNASVAVEKYARLVEALQIPAGTRLDQHIEALNARIGMPTGLRAMGVDPACFAAVAELAMSDHCTPTNARPPDAADYRRLLEEAA